MKMKKVKKRHLLLAKLAFPLNSSDEAVKLERDRNGRVINRNQRGDQHNRNYELFMEYISSIVNGTSADAGVRSLIRSVKEQYGYGDDYNNHEDDVDEHYLGGNNNGSFIESADIVIPKTIKSRNKFNEMVLYKNKLNRMFYLQNKDKSTSSKSVKFIKKGTAFGVEIECYIPLSVVGVYALDNACPTCTSCDVGNRCSRHPNDYSNEIGKYFTTMFKKRGIKNIQQTYDGSLSSNQNNGNDLRMYFGAEFRVICSSEDKFDNLNKFCELLTQIGAKVDSTCGLHVHIDQRHATFDQYITSVERLNNSLFGLAQIVPASRKDEEGFSIVSGFNFPVINERPQADYEIDDDGRNDIIVDKLDNYIVAALNPAELYKNLDTGRRAREHQKNMVKAFKSVDNTKLVDRYLKISDNLVKNHNMKYALSRYTAINTHCYFNNNTVEVRLHSGTISFDKIRNWIRILKAVVNSPNFDSDSQAYQFVISRNRSNIYEWIGLTGIKDDSLIRYIVQRWTKFNTETINKTNQKRAENLDKHHAEVERQIELSNKMKRPRRFNNVLDMKPQIISFCKSELPTLMFEYVKKDKEETSEDIEVAAPLSSAAPLPPISRSLNNRLRSSLIPRTASSDDRGNGSFFDSGQNGSIELITPQVQEHTILAAQSNDLLANIADDLILDNYDLEEESGDGNVVT